MGLPSNNNMLIEIIIKIGSSKTNRNNEIILSNISFTNTYMTRINILLIGERIINQ